jgi:hypothetical protein
LWKLDRFLKPVHVPFRSLVSNEARSDDPAGARQERRSTTLHHRHRIRTEFHLHHRDQAVDGFVDIRRGNPHLACKALFKMPETVEFVTVLGRGPGLTTASTAQIFTA